MKIQIEIKLSHLFGILFGIVVLFVGLVGLSTYFNKIDMMFFLILYNVICGVFIIIFSVKGAKKR